MATDLTKQQLPATEQKGRMQMARWSVPIYIEVNAKTADDAFADVRANFCVVRDPGNEIDLKGTEATLWPGMHVDEPTKLRRGECVVG